MISHTIEFGEGRRRVYLDIIMAGDDIVIRIGGGERPHIGAISICTGADKPLTLSLPGHKDYLVSHIAAQKIFNETGRNTLVIAGIHVDDASGEDIRELMNNAEECIRRLVNESSKYGISRNKSLSKENAET